MVRRWFVLAVVGGLGCGDNVHLAPGMDAMMSGSDAMPGSAMLELTDPTGQVINQLELGSLAVGDEHSGPFLIRSGTENLRNQ